MKKSLMYVYIMLFSTALGITNCDKKISQQECVEGIFIASGSTHCPNLIKITKSANSGLPENTTISFGVVANQNDTAIINSSFNAKSGWKDGDLITFKVIRFSLDTFFHTDECIWGSYNATIEYCK